MRVLNAADGLPLRQFIEPLGPVEDMNLSFGSDFAEHQAITTLSLETIAAWMAEMGRNYASMDDKTRATYLIGNIAWAFSMNLAALHLAGRGVPDIGADAIAAAPQWYRREGQSEASMRFALRLLVNPDATFFPLDHAGIRALAVSTHRPLIDTLSSMTGIGRNALWRLVADALASGWLVRGKRFGNAVQAMAEVNAIISAAGSPLSNKQTGFVEIILNDDANPDLVLAREWFRTRGGCCRYYTTAESEGDYCTTCVLRPAESQAQRLRINMKVRLQTSA